MRLSLTTGAQATGWSVLMLGLTVLGVYASSVSTGFFADDYNFLVPLVQLDGLDYFIRYFDPRLQTMWYRPVQGVQLWIEWQLFGANPLGYHVANVLIHWLNVSLLFALVHRLAHHPRIAFLAALFYATFPVYALAVNWINITDPLMTIFYLSGIWFWLNYRQSHSLGDYLIVLLAYLVALLCKQMAVTLPMVLFLIDRWLSIPCRTWRACLHYAPFIVVVGIFALAQYAAQSTHTFAAVFGYSLGTHIISMLIQYFSLMVFPWGYYPPTDTQIVEGFPFADTGNLLWLTLVLVLLACLITLRNERTLLTLSGIALVVITPVLPFPFVELRYLYLPTMVPAILLALWFEHGFVILRNARWFQIASALAVGAIIIGSIASVANANAGIAEIARQRRVPFRDIERQHRTFPPDTHLYFIDPVSPLSELTGMFLLRYGRAVSVSGNDAPTPTRIRDHSNTFVYWFDGTGKPSEVKADTSSVFIASPSLPVTFEPSIVLDDVEIVQSRVKRGDNLIVLLYWHADDMLDRDYTVFVHLENRQGNVIVGYDAQPRKGAVPTSHWRPHVPIVDPLRIPIHDDVPCADDYRLRIGVYYLPTLQRLDIIGMHGQPASDSLTLQPLSIVE